MREVDFNEDGLLIDEIDKVVNKVRGIVINSNTGKILLVRYVGLYMLPGGSIDDEEGEKDSIKREILEESGIEIEDSQINPFLIINSFDKNYFDRKSGTINRLTRTTFFEIYTDKDIDDEKKNLTESEKTKGHVINYVDLDDVPQIVEDNVTDNSKRKHFDREILCAIQEYKKFKSNDMVKIKR